MSSEGEMPFQIEEFCFIVRLCYNLEDPCNSEDKVNPAEHFL